MLPSALLRNKLLGEKSKLAANAAPFKVFEIELQVASLEDIIRSKKASDRLQDRQGMIILQEMLPDNQQD